MLIGQIKDLGPGFTVFADRKIDVWDVDMKLRIIGAR